MISVWQFFIHETGWVAKIVLGILLLFSLVSWAIILAKYVTLKRIKRQNSRFREHFFTAGKFSEARELAARYPQSTNASIFMTAYRELNEQSGSPEMRWDLLERLVRRTARQSIVSLRPGLPFLATTAGATPFIGLFGTVWGIMNAFRQIGISGSSSLATVAPGISEALINTAAGLFAAIPALIMYNSLLSTIRTLGDENDDFIDQIMVLLMKRVPRRTGVIPRREETGD